MKIKIMCQQCFERGLKEDKDKTVPFVPSYPYWVYPTIEIDRWPFFEMICPKGHKHYYILNNELFEVLFQQATYCLKDGYYRESIGTYHVALERFLEYCIEIMCYSSGRVEQFNMVWKEIKRQSERQLGAFYFLWYAIIQEPPIILNPGMVELRNKVIHQGKLSSEEEAKEYGEYVFNYIRNADKKLKNVLGDKLLIYRGLRLYRVCEEDKGFKKAQELFVKTDHDIIINEKNIGSIIVPSFISDFERFPNYLSCFNKLDEDVIGFLK